MSLLRTWRGGIGASIVAVVIIIALLGPLFAPHPPTAPVGIPAATPSDGLPFGTDSLGRDVLSRVLDGGRTILWVALATTALAYIAGAAIGLIAGYRRGRMDTLLMRSTDVFLVIPGILLLLLVIAGLGRGIGPLIIGVVIVQVPGIARFVRAATLEVGVRGFVEAAEIRGESTSAILRREIVPNVTSPIIADASLRFTFSILFIAAANFLGLGLEPPKADWALMIGENRQTLSLNPWALGAPAVMVILLTVGVNLFGDALAQHLGRERTVRDAGVV